MKKLIFLLLLLPNVSKAQSLVHDELARLRNIPVISDPSFDTLLVKQADDILDAWFTGSSGAVQAYLDGMNNDNFYVGVDIYLSYDMEDLLDTMREDDTAYFMKIETSKVLICTRKREKIVLVLIYSL